MVEEDVSEARAPKFVNIAGEVIGYWFEWSLNKHKRHQCSLVSIDNPNGLTPRTNTNAS